MKIILCILSVALIGLEVFAPIPQPRYSGDGVLLNKRLYYFGGRLSNVGGQDKTINDLMYLDISKSFTVSEAQDDWQGANPVGELQAPNNYLFGMGVIPEDNSIMIYGGAGENKIELFLENTVMLYNATDNSWRTLRDPQEPELKQIYGGTCSHGDNHKAYIFGGQCWDGFKFPRFGKQMFIYDFTERMWSPSAKLPENTPVRYNLPTTLVGKDLYYIGGQTSIYNETAVVTWDLMVSMKDILVFNIETSTWETRQATGADIPAGRLSHTITSRRFCTRKPNSQEIILYGGRAAIPDTTPIQDFCYVLDTSSMTWTKKVPAGQGPGALYGQAAVFADNSSLLFIMFGVNSAGNVLNGFSVLDTDAWTWREEYTSYPNEDANAASDSGGSNSSSGLSSGSIAGIVVGCVAGVTLVAALCFIRKRRYRNGKNQEKIADDVLDNTIINTRTSAAIGDGRFKPEDTKRDIPNATLSPLLPAESTPPYRGHIPDETNSPIVFSVQNTTNAQAVPSQQNVRPVKPDGD